MKIIGVVPARLAASRFPGKPLLPVCGRPMVEHVFARAQMFGRWDGLYGDGKPCPLVVSCAEGAPWPGQRTPVLSGDLDATG